MPDIKDMTVFNLSQYTAMEVLDRVEAHLLQQGCRSDAGNGGCMYRGIEGRSCAVGCLVPDEAYTFELEGKPWWAAWPIDGEEMYATARRVLDASLAHAHLLVELQCIHDRIEPDEWRFALRQLRRRLFEGEFT